MGRNSQSRRAARSKDRARQRARDQHAARSRPSNQDGPPSPFGAPRGPSPSAGQDAPATPFGDPHGAPRSGPTSGSPDARDKALHLWTRILGDASSFGRSTPRPQLLAALAELPVAAADEVAELLVADQVEAMVAHGWQPAEIHRIARRQHHVAGRLVAIHLRRHLDHHLRQHGTRLVDPRWQDQVDELGEAAPHSRWFASWRDRCRLDRATAYLRTGELLIRLGALPALRALIPPPGSPASAQLGQSASDPALHKVRGLLAKAESTEFEAEAAALTAKAQELMTRHAIDQAALDIGRPVGSPATVRIAIEAPYVDAKSLLLQMVATQTRCRTVALSGLDMSEVVGFPADLAAVELLFTSLLVQAQRALTEAGSAGGANARTRSPSFRATFLRSYAIRIGERLEETNAHVMAGTRADSARYLPVLRSQEEAIDAHVAREYGTLSSGRLRGGYDHAGATSGRLAADQAELTSGRLRDS